MLELYTVNFRSIFTFSVTLVLNLRSKNNEKQCKEHTSHTMIPTDSKTLYQIRKKNLFSIVIQHSLPKATIFPKEAISNLFSRDLEIK